MTEPESALAGLLVMADYLSRGPARRPATGSGPV
jgi:hypothetical protein